MRTDFPFFQFPIFPFFQFSWKIDLLADFSDFLLGGSFAGLWAISREGGRAQKKEGGRAQEKEGGKPRKKEGGKSKNGLRKSGQNIGNPYQIEDNKTQGGSAEGDALLSSIW